MGNVEVAGEADRNADPPAVDQSINFRSVSLQTRDFDELACAFQRWRQQFQQLRGGRFSGSLLLAQAGGIQLLRVSANRVIQARGTQPHGSYVFVPARPSNLAALCRGQRLRRGKMVVLSPGDEIDHCTAEDYTSIVLTVDGPLLRRVATALGGADPQELLSGKVMVQADPAICDAFSCYLESLLGRMTAAPETPAQGGGWKEIEEECVRRLVHSIGMVDPLTAVDVYVPGRRQVVRRAEEFMLEHLDEPLTIADLCDQANVSERTLHYAFLDIHGMSPKAYMKARRLNRVRQDLKSADSRGETVASVAARWGFHHTGNFAADYRRLFGELPSDTFGERMLRVR